MKPRDERTAVPRQLDLFAAEPPTRAQVRAEERRLQDRYDELSVLLGLPPARIVLSGRRATGGVIQYGPPHVIRISLHMAPEDRDQTLLHETAHAVCFQRYGVDEGHSPRFWAIARSLGVERRAAPETERLREVRAANARYTYRCVGCTNEWSRRAPFGRARLCAACERKGRPSRLILVRRPPRRTGRQPRG